MNTVIDLKKHPELMALVFKHGQFPEQPVDVFMRAMNALDQNQGAEGANGANGAKGVKAETAAAPPASIAQKVTGRAAPGTCTPDVKFKDPIIRVLMKYPNGAGDVSLPYARPAKQVILEVGQAMKSVLKEIDN